MPKIENMNRFTVLFSTCWAIFVYISLSIFCGQDGVWAYKQLENHKLVLAQNVRSLQDVNEQLTIDTYALQKDDSVLSAYAKKMGFVHEGEYLLKISGFADTPVFVYNAGSKVLRSQIIFVPDWLSKCVGIFVFVSINLISLLLHLKKSLKSYDSIKVQG